MSDFFVPLQANLILYHNAVTEAISIIGNQVCSNME